MQTNNAEKPSSRKPLLVQLKGKLFDVANFASKHPGGEKVLRALAGEAVDEYMEGKKRILGVRHEHSEAAYQMLEKYNVDQFHKGDPILDSKKGVLPRVGSLGADYWTWIHQPYEGTIRLFDSDFMESLTRTAWYMVPLCWMPIVLFFGFSSMLTFFGESGYGIGGLAWLLLFVSGILTWTLLEYTLHKYVFHWQPSPKSPKQLVLHFLLHGLHHKTPMDGDRLVFPPAPAALIIGFFYIVYSNILPWTIFCAFGSGKLFGYICYDMTHYYLHHGSPRPLTGMHFRKVYHHNHHFKDFDAGFGISTSLWDYVFDTPGIGPL